MGGAPTASCARERGDDRRPQSVGVPRREQEVEVEGGVQLVGTHVLRQPFRVVHPRLGHKHARIVVRSRRASRHGGRSHGPRPGPSADGRPARRSSAGQAVDPTSGRPSCLDEAVGHIDPEAVDAEVEPEAQRRRRTRPGPRRTAPVEVGLLRGEQMQVPLPRATVGFGRPASTPGHRNRSSSRSGACSPVAPRPARKRKRSRSGDPGRGYERASGTTGAGRRGGSGRCRAAPAGRGRGPPAIIASASARCRTRLDVAEVRHVVAGVLHRRRIPRVDPQRRRHRGRRGSGNRERRPAMSPMPSPSPSAKLRMYTW